MKDALQIFKYYFEEKMYPDKSHYIATYLNPAGTRSLNGLDLKDGAGNSEPNRTGNTKQLIEKYMGELFNRLPLTVKENMWNSIHGRPNNSNISQNRPTKKRKKIVVDGFEEELTDNDENSEGEGDVETYNDHQNKDYLLEQQVKKEFQLYETAPAVVKPWTTSTGEDKYLLELNKKILRSVQYTALTST